MILSAITNETDVTRFDAAIRKVFKEVDIFQKITLQEKCAVFQQKYDSKLKMWIDMESPFAAIMEIITLLLENNQPVIIGMISHKISLITIFGHKHFRQKFLQKFDIFHKKISTAFDFGSYLGLNSKF